MALAKLQTMAEIGNLFSRKNPMTFSTFSENVHLPISLPVHIFMVRKNCNEKKVWFNFLTVKSSGIFDLKNV